MMSLGLRKFVLTSHIASSVGWLGAVAGFLALAIAGLWSNSIQTANAAYIAMELVGWYVIVPLGLASLLTGLVQSFSTKWGLFRHYWVLIKFLLTLGAMILLIVHIQPTSRLASAARDSSLTGDNLHSLKVQLVADGAGALLVLLINTVLSIYKPLGLTRFGAAGQNEKDNTTLLSGSKERRSWGFYVLIGLIGLLVLFIVVHLAGGGLGGHSGSL